MKKKLVILALSVIATCVQAQTFVDGHFRSDGSYVPPHYRTEPNYTAGDNWSTKGNYNPYTGEHGSKRCKSSDPYCSINSY